MSYNSRYKRLIEEAKIITVKEMVRGKFYAIKSYTDVKGERTNYTETNMPIIFTLFVSKPKNIVHCIKISDLQPIFVQRLMGKFVDKDAETIKMRGNAKNIYKKVVSKVPAVTDEAYRTYSFSGIEKLLELDMNVNELTPRNMRVKGIDEKSQLKNK